MASSKDMKFLPEYIICMACTYDTEDKRKAETCRLIQHYFDMPVVSHHNADGITMHCCLYL